MSPKIVYCLLPACVLTLGGCDTEREPSGAREQSRRDGAQSGAPVAPAGAVKPPPDTELTESAERFAEHDEDRNGTVTRQEFQSTFRIIPPFQKWDANRDSMLSEAEFVRGLFTSWDRDADRRIQINEFLRGAGAWFQRADSQGSFKAWDDDADGVLAPTEFDRHMLGVNACSPSGTIIATGASTRTSSLTSCIEVGTSMATERSISKSGERGEVLLGAAVVIAVAGRPARRK